MMHNVNIEIHDITNFFLNLWNLRKLEFNTIQYVFYYGDV